MFRGKAFHNMIFTAVMAVLSVLPASAQVDGLLRRADSLHVSYDFVGARDIYMEVLDSLDVEADSLLLRSVQQKLVQVENGRNMSRFVQKPKVAGKRKFLLEEFFLYYPLEDRSWRPVPNVLDKNGPDAVVKALYAPDWDDMIYFSAASEGGSRDILMTEQMDTAWTAPVVDSVLSTATADEIYPMLSPDRRTMFFASRGLYDVGGYDLYKAEWDAAARRWSAPQNMGFPYSSPADDFLYAESEDGEYAVFASNRECASRDSVYVYVLHYETNPVHVPMTSPEELRKLSLLDLPVKEKVEETVTDIPDNELTLKYMSKMDEVKMLRDSISANSSTLEALRNEYVFSNDPGERVRLTNEILSLEMAIPGLQRSLDKANNDLRGIEMEFLKEGIFLNMDMAAGDDEDEGPEIPEYEFRRRSMGDSLAINVMVPEVKFDYTFRIGPEAIFAEDQNIPAGIVYQIQLFSGGRKADLSELKGLCPVYEHRTPSGMYTYRVGLFRSYEDAKTAIDKVRRRGFSDAYITAFIDSQEVSVVTARTAEAKASNEVLLYEVRIMPDSGELEQEVVEGMIRLAMGKDIARVEAEDGTQVFIVGPFDNKAMAEELAAYVRSKISGKVTCELRGNELIVN